MEYPTCKYRANFTDMPVHEKVEAQSTPERDRQGCITSYPNTAKA
jgi:hypothetical protein